MCRTLAVQKNKDARRGDTFHFTSGLPFTFY